MNLFKIPAQANSIKKESESSLSIFGWENGKFYTFKADGLNGDLMIKLEIFSWEVVEQDIEPADWWKRAIMRAKLPVTEAIRWKLW